MRRVGDISRARYATRFDGLEFAASILPRAHTPETEKGGIDGFRLRVIRVVVLAVCVRLPYFDHGIVESYGIAIEDTNGEQDTLALCFGTRNAADTTLIGRETKVKKGTDGLGGGRNQIPIRCRMGLRQGRARRYRICSRWPTAAASFPDRTWRSFAASPSRPESTDRLDQRRTT